MKIQLFSLIILTAFTLAGTALLADGKALQGPYPNYTNIEFVFDKQKKCPKPPPPIHDMQYKSVYTKRTNGLSIVDKKAQKKYKKETKTLRDFGNKIATWIENSFEDKSDLQCVVQWLTEWADKNALLGGKVSDQGQAVRKWSLASLSSTYSQVRHSKIISNEDRLKIDQWLQNVSDQVVKDYSQGPERMSRRNNHIYWSAWAVMITSTLSNDMMHYAWAKNKFAQGINDITEDGTLPLEMERQGKAFNYHVFALSPLIMMAETLEINGDRGYTPALHRLVDRVLEGLENKQAYFKEKTGVKQNLTGTVTKSHLAWIEVYHARFPNNITRKWIKKMRPFHQRRIGGNTTRLFARDYSEEE